METRKVQLTGSSSYVVTLPKEWITLQRINKNDPVRIITRADGTLLILPAEKEDAVYNVKEFSVDEIDDPVYLFRLLVSAYINGYSVITIKSKNRIESFARECAIRFTQTAIGPEIIEESINSITMKDLLNPVEMPMDKTIKRMHILARTMHEDAINALNKKDKLLVQDIEPRDRDVDRLHWLISRQFNIILRNIAVTDKMKVTGEEATYLFLISRLVERIGDHAVKIAKNVRLLVENPPPGEITEMIAQASDKSLEIFSSTMDALTARDMKAANKNIEAINDLVLLCEKINNEALNINDVSSIYISYIAESIRRTGEYSADISELLLNYLVKE